MKHLRFIILLFPLFVLLSCSTENPDKMQKSNEPNKNITSYNQFMNKYSTNIEKNWGKNFLVPDPKDYVQYRDNFRTRVHINFVSGKLIIETVNPNYQNALYQATLQTLLMGEPDDVIAKNEAYNPSQVPFLYEQVIDQHGEPIRWRWRADKFSEYLVENKITSHKAQNGMIIYSIEVKLVSDHVHERALRFMSAINKNSKTYQIDSQMIAAIIEVESNFNPFAVSKSDALGLMQVQQHTAGRDLYIRAGKKGEPSRSFLLDPDNNIMMGTAYLALIRDQYLAGITNKKTKEYAMIAAYNGGAGSILKMFSSDRKKAITLINQLTPEQFYYKLTHSHSSLETRNYIQKVMAIMNKKR